MQRWIMRWKTRGVKYDIKKNYFRCNSNGHNETVIYDSSKEQLCPDGSILPLKTNCPMANGCPKDLPLLCGKLVNIFNIFK